jgi:hypothetical protein
VEAAKPGQTWFALEWKTLLLQPACLAECAVEWRIYADTPSRAWDAKEPAILPLMWRSAFQEMSVVSMLPLVACQTARS